ncbi:hypothetical protein HID58_087231 [Brassica napus]|uniref:Uncharacterized protein n=1 Tax=Brassica napus TaxID=3708 RepID=A0ABQ7XSQ2_BRANA|nr:hypothetical protein HID58_087231 [Brassica napus]
MPEQPHVSFPTYFLRAHRLFDSISPPSCLPDSLFMASTENPPIGVMRREEEEIARSMSSIIRIFVVKKLRDFCCVEFIPFETFSKHLFHYKDFHHLSRD